MKSEPAAEESEFRKKLFSEKHAALSQEVTVSGPIVVDDDDLPSAKRVKEDPLLMYVK